VSHDLRAPLRAISGFSQILEDDYGNQLDDTAADYLGRIRKSVLRMDELIGSLLELSRLSRRAITPTHIDMSQLARTIINQKREEQPQCRIDIQVDDVPPAHGDAKLIGVLLENLIENACKYSTQQERPCIRFGCREDIDGPVYYVKDNGVGFDMKYSDKLFGVFQRLHTEKQFEGTGIGLATVKRIVDRHGGRVWAEGARNKGATFYFTLPESPLVIQEDEWHSSCA
jgi:light-regulated signal transduction histidine kinase (bacteriophytochrome)